MMEEENVRLYTFRIPGYVPGIAREFPGGMQAYINDVTLEVLAEGPIGQPLHLPQSHVQAQNVPQAPVHEVQEASGVAADLEVGRVTTHDYANNGG